MISEWLKVMLEEIARKKTESEQARIEVARRKEEHAGDGGPSRADAPAGGDGPACGEEVRPAGMDAAPDPAPGAARRAQ